ncbi:hypothetical protein, partial [Rhodocyclus gracilis]|uniref:hypothetical protein n=1 Tax=Rhodocyclus gracilis TaxID=2929842 RepID=UPI001AD9BEE4
VNVRAEKMHQFAVTRYSKPSRVTFVASCDECAHCRVPNASVPEYAVCDLDNKARNRFAPRACAEAVAK